jgi:hypothetical protein
MTVKAPTTATARPIHGLGGACNRRLRVPVKMTARITSVQNERRARR